MRLFVEIGKNDTGKTTRLHMLADMLADALYEYCECKCYQFRPKKWNTRSTKSNDVKRTYRITASPFDGEFVVSISSDGDGVKQVTKSFTYGKKSDVHVMAARTVDMLEKAVRGNAYTRLSGDGDNELCVRRNLDVIMRAIKHLMR